jgi:DNA-binding XRE family transcriptional regulator
VTYARTDSLERPHEQARPEPAADRPTGPRSVIPGGGAGAPTFADWMQDVLRTQGLTQEAAARQLGVSVKTVSRWVGGATEPRMRDLRRIQEVFGEVPLP